MGERGREVSSGRGKMSSKDMTEFQAGMKISEKRKLCGSFYINVDCAEH